MRCANENGIENRTGGLRQPANPRRLRQPARARWAGGTGDYRSEGGAYLKVLRRKPFTNHQLGNSQNFYFSFNPPRKCGLAGLK